LLSGFKLVEPRGKLFAKRDGADHRVAVGALCGDRHDEQKTTKEYERLETDGSHHGDTRVASTKMRVTGMEDIAADVYNISIITWVQSSFAEAPNLQL